jgi:hypothetical protein
MILIHDALEDNEHDDDDADNDSHDYDNDDENENDDNEHDDDADNDSHDYDSDDENDDKSLDSTANSKLRARLLQRVGLSLHPCKLCKCGEYAGRPFSDELCLNCGHFRYQHE